MGDETYTHKEVMSAVNRAANLMEDGLELRDRDTDIINLLVNAVESVLRGTAGTLDDVMDEQYEEGAEEVRSWF